MQQNLTVTVRVYMSCQTEGGGGEEGRTMTIALLLARVDGDLAVLGDVPARLEVLALALALVVERLTHLGEHLVVGPALHG